MSVLYQIKHISPQEVNTKLNISKRTDLIKWFYLGGPPWPVVARPGEGAGSGCRIPTLSLSTLVCFSPHHCVQPRDLVSFLLLQVTSQILWWLLTAFEVVVPLKGRGNILPHKKHWGLDVCHQMLAASQGLGCSQLLEANPRSLTVAPSLATKDDLSMNPSHMLDLSYLLLLLLLGRENSDFQRLMWLEWACPGNLPFD